jgi:hypothetical protein
MLVVLGCHQQKSSSSTHFKATGCVSQRVWTIAGGDTLEHLSTRDDDEQAGGEKEL